MTRQQKLRRLQAKLVSKAALELTMQQKLGSPFLSERKRGERCPSVQVGATEAEAAEELKLELKS